MKSLIVFLISILAVHSQVPNIRISEPTSLYPEEVTIAINPLNPDILAAGANINYFYQSLDGGMSWTEYQLTSTLGVWGDPCVVFDGYGNLYFAHLSYPISGYWIDRIVVQKSTDFGSTWNDGAGIGLNTSPKVQDKEWLAVDLTDSPFRNNIYVAWTEFDDYSSANPADSSRILFSRSTDQGETWSEPVRISEQGGDCIDSDETVEGAVPAVGPDGEIYLAWAGPLGIMFDKSTDGGITFGEDIFVTDQPGGWDFDVSGIYRCNGLPVTLCDNSRSPHRGNIYVMWGDQRNGVNNSDVFIIKSTDKGETWGEVIKINDDDTQRHQFFPWITLDSTTGFLYAVFYDRRNTTGVQTDVYVARSTDGGETFENFKVSESPFEPVSYIFYGDYTNIAAYDKKIYPIWMRLDNQTLSIWTAPFNDPRIADVEEDKLVISTYELYQNFPNPFNPSTTIGYQIPEDAFVNISIYDGIGKIIRNLSEGYKSKGSYDFKFDGSALASGIYFYRLTAYSENGNKENFSQVKKMLLIK